MDAKNFLRIKPKDQLASHPAVQPLPKPELEAQSELQKESIENLTQLKKSVDRAKPKSDPELQLPGEPVGYLESLARDREGRVYRWQWVGVQSVTQRVQGINLRATETDFK